MNDLISVIVPIYNVENYLKKCIESIQNQTYSNLEILLVEDGSPDGCGKICDTYAARDDRIRVIHKQNGGLSDARNYGIEAAKGEYFLFVDSDDFIHCSMVEILYQMLCKTQAQISICSYQSVEDGEEVQYQTPVCTKEDTILMSEKQLYDSSYYIDKRVEFIVAWNKLYHKSLFEKVRYPKGKVHEDEFTTYKLLYQAKGVAYNPIPLYYYVQRSTSIMGEKFSEKRLLTLDALRERMTFFEQKKEDRLWILSFETYRRSFLRYVGEVRQDGSFPKSRLKPYQNYYQECLGKYEKLVSQSAMQRVQYQLSGKMPFLYSALLEKKK